jgi:hypothetical protein
MPSQNKALSHSGGALLNRTSNNIGNKFLKGKRFSTETYSLWEKAIASKTLEGITWIGNLNSNGAEDKLHPSAKRDTILFSPNTTSFVSPIELIYFFHGIGEFTLSDFTDRYAKSCKDLSIARRNFIIVIPELSWSKLCENFSKRFLPFLCQT